MIWLKRDKQSKMWTSSKHEHTSVGQHHVQLLENLFNLFTTHFLPTLPFLHGGTGSSRVLCPSQLSVDNLRKMVWNEGTSDRHKPVWPAPFWINHFCFSNQRPEMKAWPFWFSLIAPCTCCRQYHESIQSEAVPVQSEVGPVQREAGPVQSEAGPVQSEAPHGQ